ncbi:MAG: TRAP transporter TatT component family protein [Acidobacteriia bacterium]|nr:TRAP transporter TatT component family protein [Terriglobia bacterium]
MRIALLVALTLLLPAGCARALREPRPLDAIAGETAPTPREEVEVLVSRAEALYARRDLPSVREAAGTWLRVAAADRTSVAGVLGAVKARVWLADHEPDPAARNESAGSAVEAAQWCGRIAPDDPACSYWLGVALGVQARERPATALSALPKMVQAFERAAQAAPGLDHGGPDRALALLHLRAPGWPTGPGDSEKGLEHARRAVEIEGGYPANRLAFAEALRANGLESEARQAYEEAVLAARRSAESGDPDAPDWISEAEDALGRK